MSEVIELEASYLAARIPEGLAAHEHIDIEDIYFPATEPHAKMRIRHKGDKYEFTKKIQLDPGDAGQQQELSVDLTAEEYKALSRGDGRNVYKARYFLPYEGRTAEVDIFKGALEGLVIIEFEFDTLEEKNAFTMPDFCLADVTQEEFIAGGMLAGKAYQDIQEGLLRFNYKPLE